MKQKTIRFIIMVLAVFAVCVFAVGYYEFNKIQARIYESKAVIAQSQPEIEIAKGQKAINNAVAISVRTTSFVNAIMSLLPWLVLGGNLVYKLFFERTYNAQIYK